MNQTPGRSSVPEETEDGLLWRDRNSVGSEVDDSLYLGLGLASRTAFPCSTLHLILDKRPRSDASLNSEQTPHDNKEEPLRGYCLGDR